MSEQDVNSISDVEESYTSRLERRWEDRFQRLQVYKRKHGDCLVPAKYEEDPQLGNWLRVQQKTIPKGEASD